MTLEPGDLAALKYHTFVTRSGSAVDDDSSYAWLSAETLVFVVAVVHCNFAQRQTFVHFIFEGVVYVVPLENFKKL